MNIKNNARSHETEKRFEKALLSLLSKGQKLESIAVSRLCDEAGINRSTFYAHYNIVLDVFEKLEEKTLENTSKVLSHVQENVADRVISLFAYVKENKEIFQVLLLQNSDDGFIESLMKNSFRIYDDLKEYQKDKRLYGYVESFGSNGSKALLLSWLNNDCADSPENMAKLVIHLNQVIIDSSFKINALRQ